MNVRSFCHRPSSCRGGLTANGNNEFSGVMALPVCALLTTGLSNTALNETLSGTVPVGAKLLTPAILPERAEAEKAAEGMSSKIRISSKNL